MKRLVAGLLVALGLVAAPNVSSAAQSGVVLDTTFNPGGSVPGVVQSPPNIVDAAVPTVGGATLVLAGHKLMRLTASGVLDATFGDAGTPGIATIASLLVRASIVVDSSGNSYVGDGFTIWRVSAAGVVGASPLISSGGLTDPFANVFPVGVDSHGRLLVSGTKGFGSGFGGPRVIARLLAGGGLDPTFAAAATIPGLHEDSGVGQVALGRDDSLFLFDAPSSVIGSIRHVSADGVDDLGWAGGAGFVSVGATVSSGELDHFSFDSQGRLLMSGVRLPVTGCVHCVWIRRVTAAGVLEASFGDAATQAATRFEGVSDIVRSAGGHLMVLGQPATAQVSILVLNDDGTVDPAFGWRGGDAGLYRVAPMLSSSPVGMAADGEGRLIIAGIGGGLARTIAPTPQIGLTSVVPERLLDTRPETLTGYSGPKPGVGGIVELQVTGVGTTQVPSNASAVVLNVTGTDASANGYVTVWPCGVARPTVSNLNLVAGATTPNLVVVGVGSGGKVCMFTQTGTHLIADISGYFPAAASFTSVVPERLLDTRPETLTGYSGPKPGVGGIVELQVTGVGTTQVPSNASAVVLNVTGTDASANGYVTVWPCGVARPTVSNLNLVAGATTPNLVVVGVGSGGKVCMFTQTGTHLIADISGYFP